MNDHHNDHPELDALREELSRQQVAIQTGLLDLEVSAQLALDALDPRKSDPERARRHLDTLLDALPRLRSDLEGRQPPRQQRPQPSEPVDPVQDWLEGVLIASKLCLSVEREPRKSLLLEALKQLISGRADDVAVTPRLSGFCEVLQQELMKRPSTPPQAEGRRP